MPLDIGIGIFGAIITAKLTGLPLDWQLVFLGASFSIMPDIDFAIYFARKRHLDEMAHEHRDILHNPLIYIPIGFVIFSFWSFPIASLFAAMSFWHFLHDSIPEGGGWGLRWLYPFSAKYYKFFSGSDGSFSKHFVISWTRAEQKQAAKQFGDSHWVTHYLRSPEFLFELTVFIIAIIALGISWR